MRVTNKLIIAVALFTALCVGLTFSVGAIREDIINSSDYNFALNMRLYQDDTLVFDKDSVSYLNLYQTSLKSNSSVYGFTIDNYYSTEMPGTTSSPDNITYNRGAADIYQFWGGDPLFTSDPEDDVFISYEEATKKLLSEDILISKVTAWFTFGFSSSPTSYPFINIPLTGLSGYLYWGGHILDTSLYDFTWLRLVNTSHKQDTISGRWFDYRALQAQFTFKDPLAPAGNDPSSYVTVCSIPFECEAFQNLYALVGVDEVHLEYYYRDEYEAGIINTNRITIIESKNALNNLTESLEVPKPDSQTVDSVLGNINTSAVSQFTGLYSDSLITDTNFNNLITTSLLSSIGIAFIGYAIHGKKG